MDKSTSQDSYVKPAAGFGNAERAAYKANKLAGSKGGDWFSSQEHVAVFIIALFYFTLIAL